MNTDPSARLDALLTRVEALEDEHNSFVREMRSTLKRLLDLRERLLISERRKKLKRFALGWHDDPNQVLVTRPEIAALFGVSTQRVQEYLLFADFPAPVAYLPHKPHATGKNRSRALYDKQEVIDWRERRKKNPYFKDGGTEEDRPENPSI